MSFGSLVMYKKKSLGLGVRKVDKKDNRTGVWKPYSLFSGTVDLMGGVSVTTHNQVECAGKEAVCFETVCKSASRC